MKQNSSPTTLRYSIHTLNDCWMIEFECDEDVTTINVPSEIEGRKITNIGYCATLPRHVEEVILPDSVTLIGSYAFSYFNNLKQICLPKSVSCISHAAFSYCPSLQTVFIPANVEQIYVDAFKDCEALSFIVLNKPLDTLSSVWPDYKKYLLQLIAGFIKFESQFTKQEIRSEYLVTCKRNRKRLVRLFIDLHDTTALEYLASLDIFAIPNFRAEMIDYAQKQSCKECADFISNYCKEHYDIGAEQRKLAHEKDKRDSIVETIEECLKFGKPIPSDTLYMKELWKWEKRGDGTLAITSYKGLENTIIVPSIIGGKKVTAIADEAFSPLRAYLHRKRADYLLNRLSKVILPEGITYIGKRAFNGCDSLTEISMPSTLRIIEDCSFQDCSNLCSINLPEGISNIGDGAFGGCKSLKSIAISSYVNLGNGVFAGCSSLTGVDIPNGRTQIEGSLFSNCTNLAYISIPESVKSIGSRAFFKCSALASINIPDGVDVIHASTFYGCSNISTISLPSTISKIESDAFSFCAFTNIDLPSSITEIGNSAFEGCAALEYISLPDAITKLSDSLFRSCKNLSLIKLPASLVSVGQSAFRGCSSLTEISFPNGTREIGMEAFSYCRKLQRVDFPTSVQNIARNSFDNCPDLTIVAEEGSYALMCDSLLKYPCVITNTGTYIQASDRLDFINQQKVALQERIQHAEEEQKLQALAQGSYTTEIWFSEAIYKSVYAGHRKKTRELIIEALQNNVSPIHLFRNGLIKGFHQTISDCISGKVWIPEFLVTSSAYKLGLTELKNNGIKLNKCVVIGFPGCKFDSYALGDYDKMIDHLTTLGLGVYDFNSITDMNQYADVLSKNDPIAIILVKSMYEPLGSCFSDDSLIAIKKLVDDKYGTNNDKLIIMDGSDALHSIGYNITPFLLYQLLLKRIEDDT